MDCDRIIYVVDADPAIGEALDRLLGTYGIAVRVFPNTEEFLDTTRDDPATGICLLVDANLPGRSGLSLIQALRKRAFGLPILLLTNVAAPDIREQATRLGVVDVIEKSLINSYLFDRLAELLPDDNRMQGFERVTLAGGAAVSFRAMRAADADMEQEFVRGLSLRSRRLRFFSPVKELSRKLLHQLTHPDYPSSFAIIATVDENGRERQIGVARYALSETDGTAEFAVVVADEWQGQGIARRLLSAITSAAVVAGIPRLEGLVLRENTRMLNLARELGFESMHSDDPGIVRVGKDLSADRYIAATK